MLVLSLPTPDHELPPEPRRAARGGVVWRPHYEGFTRIAYRDGHAIAGISGPWSSQYVLIWWQPSQPVRRVEVFDSLDDAMAAVARDGAAENTARWSGVLDALCREPLVLPRPAWITGLARWAGRLFGHTPPHQRVQRRARREETDLRGLNFRALR
jgi:hypothetical protein